VTVKTHMEFERATAMMHESLPWVLGRKRGFCGSSPVVARGRRATDATGQQGVVAIAT
jgi:hypothetical protein